MPSLYLIRHGRTAWNRDWRIQGSLDVPLDDEGRRQAQALARAFAEVPLAAVFASPMRRATDTAEAVAQLHGLQVRFDARLRERDWGAYQGMRREDAAIKYPDAEAALREDPVHARPPGGESFWDLRTRAEAVLREIASSQQGSVAVVCHGGTIVAALTALLGLDNWPQVRFVIENASISLLDVGSDGGVVTHYVNRRDHLA